MDKSTHTIIAVAVLLAAGMIFSPTLSAMAQMNTTTTTNSTAAPNEGSANATTQTSGAEGQDTFTAIGRIGSLIDKDMTATTATNDTMTSAANETITAVSEPPYIVVGDWNLGAADGNLTDFSAGFDMVHTDGTGHHTLEIVNFRADNGTTVQIVQNGTTMVAGTADLLKDGELMEAGVDVVFTIENLTAAAITIGSDHFQGQPVYGIVDSIVDVNGQELVSEVRGAVATAGAIVSDAGENLTESSEQVGNRTGNVVGNIANTTGNVLEEAGEAVSDFFDGGQ